MSSKSVGEVLHSLMKLLDVLTDIAKEGLEMMREEHRAQKERVRSPRH